MAAVFNFDLQLDADCGFSETFQWYQDDGALVVDGAVESGTPVDLTGATAQLMIRSLPTDASPLVSISTTPSSSGSIVLGGALGTIVVAIAASALTAFVGGLQAGYDLLIFWPTGASPTKLLSGSAFVAPTYTH